MKRAALISLWGEEKIGEKMPLLPKRNVKNPLSPHSTFSRFSLKSVINFENSTISLIMKEFSLCHLKFERYGSYNDHFEFPLS